MTTKNCSNGKLDPWSAGGVLKNVSQTVKAYFIEGAAHHLDLRLPNPADPADVNIGIVPTTIKSFSRQL